MKNDKTEQDIDFFYQQTRDQIQHEDTLLNYRATWLLALQTSLFALYGIMLRSANTLTLFEISLDPTAYDAFLKVVAYFGAVICLVFLIGIWAAVKSMRNLVEEWDKQASMFKLTTGKTSQGRVRYPQIIGRVFKRSISVGLLPIVSLPVFATAMWYCVSPGPLIFVSATGQLILAIELVFPFFQCFWNFLLGVTGSHPRL